MTQPFLLEALVDFVDDCISAARPIEPAHIDEFVRLLRDKGVQRLVWISYSEVGGGWRGPEHKIECPGGTLDAPMHNYRATIRALGDPLRVAADACRRYGLQIHATFKPYEQGLSAVIPEGCPHTPSLGLLPHIGGSLFVLDPFVVSHPQLRVKRRSGDIPPNVASIPIRAIRLIKSDDKPTRITRERLQLWASEKNWQYTRLDVPFEVVESVEPCPGDVVNGHDHVVTRAGAPRRVLTLKLPGLQQRYVLVTTDIADGQPDFTNTGTRLMEAVGPDGRVVPGVFANEASFIYNAFTRDFRQNGLAFDNGWGNATVHLDTPNASGHTGFIAYTRGRNAYLPGCLCESEPAVREQWLRQLRAILDAGVDGVDFREENHCTHTDYSWDYGHNDVVLRAAEELKAGTLEERIATVRGAAYTDFLVQASKMIRARGARARIHLNIDWHRKTGRPGARALAYPGHMDFPWAQWIDGGHFDDVTLRNYHYPFEAIFDDPVARAMIERSRARNLPIYVPRYIRGGTDGAYAAQYDRLRADGRFAGFQLYETNTMLRLDAQGQWNWVETNDVRAAVEKVFEKHRA